MESLKDMTIGILFESKEWSTFALRDHIAAMGAPVKLFDLQEDADKAELLSCSLIVNRVFASAVFRGHQKALDQTPAVIRLLQEHNIPMINPAEAHDYETSKTRVKETLAAHGILVPKSYGIFFPAQSKDNVEIPGIEYPCILKPDCGGRTSYTYIVQDRLELIESIEGSPDIRFIAEEYIRPDKGYVTRLEVIDHVCKLALKRSVTKTGLSAYHLGSEYDFYNELPGKIEDTAVRAMDLLRIEAGSMDIIENKTGFYIIDVNSVSNASEDNTEMFKFDLMKETAAYAVKIYGNLSSNKQERALSDRS